MWKCYILLLFFLKLRNRFLSSKRHLNRYCYLFRLYFSSFFSFEELKSLISLARKWGRNVLLTLSVDNPTLELHLKFYVIDLTHLGRKWLKVSLYSTFELDYSSASYMAREKLVVSKDDLNLLDFYWAVTFKSLRNNLNLWKNNYMMKVKFHLPHTTHSKQHVNYQHLPKTTKKTIIKQK